MRKYEGAKTSDREVSGFEFRWLFGIWHSDLARGGIARGIEGGRSDRVRGY